MIRKLFILLLFRLLDKRETYANIDEERIEEWLSRQPNEPGFREYVRKRDLQLLKTIGMGISQANTTVWVGQRYELLRMTQIAQKAKERKKPKEKGRRQK